MTDKNKSRWKLLLAIALCVVMLIFEYANISYSTDPRRNQWISDIVARTCGCVAAFFVLSYLGVHLFGKVVGWVFLIPAIVVAIDNFPFYSFFKGNMQLLYVKPIDVLLFAISCVLTGVFEEFVFRGMIIMAFAGIFSKDKRGVIKTVVFSSVLFGVAHLGNITSGDVGGTLLQIGYTTLTGGLFAFVLIKTQNVLCCAFAHGLYNFCGMLLSEQGLGSGVIFDLGTAAIMAIISVIVAIFVIYHLFKYTEEERTSLYAKLGVKEE